jgi:hypothetical protein
MEVKHKRKNKSLCFGRIQNGGKNMAEIVMVHVDYENIRWRFKDYVEFITVKAIVDAFRGVAKEIGELRQIFFYGDWTRRAQDCREIEELGCRAINVLSKPMGSDRSDSTMMFGIDDQTRLHPEVTSFLIGAGDSDYKEVILRCRERGKKVYVACFVKSASRELFTMTERVYPLETRLNLTAKQIPSLPSLELLDEVEKTKLLIRRIDNLEKGLPQIVRNYLCEKILLPESKFGETFNDVNKFLNNELTKGYLEQYQIDNPKIAGKKVQCLKLKRDHQLVIDTLRPQK